MPRYLFTIELSGEGDTVEEAWADAVECFNQDPGLYHSASSYAEGELVDEDGPCRYCGGNCASEPSDSSNLCDGFAGDIDGLYGSTGSK